MENVLGAVLGIVLLLAGIAMFPIAFALNTVSPAFLPICFLIGILLLSAALPLPVAILDRLDGMR